MQVWQRRFVEFSFQCMKLQFLIWPKIAMTALVPLQMLNQALFPHIAKTLDRKFVNKCFRLILLATGCIIVIVYILAPFAVLFYRMVSCLNLLIYYMFLVCSFLVEALLLSQGRQCWFLLVIPSLLIEV